ncbi:FadR family transcriptional regulator [Paenibacillaceae bacterium]|nr:FadR family transcriptional regulator [Paenibacillaceae bacterium]
MAIFETVKKITVTEQIMDQIANLITSGALQPGEQLPNERALAMQLGVTRGRVREALRALSLIGLITIRAGEGSFVNRMEMPLPGETIRWMFHNEIHNLDEVFAARKLIESEVYRSAARHLSDEQLGVLERMIESCSASPEQEPAQQLLERLDEVDLYVGEHCGSGIYAKLMQTSVLLRRETSLKLLAVPGAYKSGMRGRTAVLEAMKARDLSLFEKSMADFFASSLQFCNSILR